MLYCCLIKSIRNDQWCELNYMQMFLSAGELVIIAKLKSWPAVWSNILDMIRGGVHANVSE